MALNTRNFFSANSIDKELFYESHYNQNFPQQVRNFKRYWYADRFSNNLFASEVRWVNILYSAFFLTRPSFTQAAFKY